MNNITAKDLMIGDWVIYNPNVFIEDEYELPKDSYPTKISCGEDIDLAFEDCYGPIPLTSEILEKNFTFDHYGFYFFGGDYHEVHIKECANGLWRVEADEIMSGLPIWKMFVSNLHELQHALRLCGIEKEIKL